MKTPFLCLLLLVSVLVSAYLVFMGVISILVGLQHTEQEGSWIPVLVGSACILAVLWILFRVIRSVVQALKKTESLNV
jgi:uncharacterized membrane protein HdeD (DUF308 family)